MPLEHRYDFGTDVDGQRINDYCHFCFDHGCFTDPALTVDRMMERSVDFLTRQTFMAEAEARAWVGSRIPTLKRWQAPPLHAAS